MQRDTLQRIRCERPLGCRFACVLTYGRVLASIPCPVHAFSLLPYIHVVCLMINARKSDAARWNVNSNVLVKSLLVV